MMRMLHPQPEELLANAAGTDAANARRFVSAHVAVCRECRRTLMEMILIAGLLLDQQPSAEFSPIGRTQAFDAAAGQAPEIHARARPSMV